MKKMENVNEGDRRFMKYSGPVYDGVEAKVPDVSSGGSLTKNPYVPHARVPVDPETWKCDNDSELSTLYKAALRTLHRMKTGEKWGNSVRSKPDDFWIDKFNEIGFTVEETENGEWFKICRDWEKYPSVPISSPGVPKISVHPLGSDVLTESNRPQTDKQKMKEIKLEALESSKSLTRLLELLRSYDEAEPKAQKVFKPLHELPLDTEACKAIFNFVHPHSTFVEGRYKEAAQFIELKGAGENCTVVFTVQGALLWPSSTSDAFAFGDLVRSLGYSPGAK